MVTVKKFDNWLEQRDVDMFKATKNTKLDEGLRGWMVRKMGGFGHEGEGKEIDLQHGNLQKLTGQIINWIEENKHNIAQKAGARDDVSMESNVASVVDRVVVAMVRRSGVLSGVDKSEAPSQFPVNLDDAKFLADYIIGVKPGHVQPPDVTWPHPEGGVDAEHPHHEADDSMFRGGKPADPDIKVHGQVHPSHYPATHPDKKLAGQPHPKAGNQNPDEGQSIPGTHGLNRSIQKKAAMYAMHYRITNPSRVIFELVKAFPRELKLPSNWGQIAGKFSTDYTAYYLPQVIIGNARSMIQSGQMSDYISTMARRLRGEKIADDDPTKKGSAPPLSPGEHFKMEARKWLTANGTKPINVGGSTTTLNDAIRLMQTLSHYVMVVLGGSPDTANYARIAGTANAVAEFIRTNINDTVLLGAVTDELDLELLKDLNLRDTKSMFSPSERHPNKSKKRHDAIFDSSGSPKQSFRAAMS